MSEKIPNTFKYLILTLQDFTIGCTTTPINIIVYFNISNSIRSCSFVSFFLLLNSILPFLLLSLNSSPSVLVIFIAPTISASFLTPYCSHSSLTHLKIVLSFARTAIFWFLASNPLPLKNIVDLVNSSEFNIENNLENRLIKIRENFYCITGIQKHIDKEFIEKDIFIEKLLEYISASSNYFNFICFKSNYTVYNIYSF